MRGIYPLLILPQAGWLVKNAPDMHSGVHWFEIWPGLS